MSLDGLKTTGMSTDRRAERLQSGFNQEDEERIIGFRGAPVEYDDCDDDSDDSGSDYFDSDEDATDGTESDNEDDTHHQSNRNFKAGVVQIQKFFTTLSDMQQMALILTLMSSLNKSHKTLIKNHLLIDSSLISSSDEDPDSKKAHEKKVSDANSLIFWQKYFQENHQNPSTIKILEILMDFLPLVNPTASNGSKSSSSLSLLYHHLISSVLTAIISSSSSNEEPNGEDKALISRGRELLSLALISPCFNDDQLKSFEPFTCKILLKSGEPGFLKASKTRESTVVMRRKSDHTESGKSGMRPSSLNLSSSETTLETTGQGSSSHKNLSSGHQGTSSSLKLPFSGEGMSGVPLYLKSLRLHKYSQLFSSLESLDQFLSLNETKLEELGVAAKGARKKFIQHLEKLNERSFILRHLLSNSSHSPDQILTQFMPLLNTPYSKNSQEVTLIIQLLLKGLFSIYWTGFTNCFLQSKMKQRTRRKSRNSKKPSKSAFSSM